MAKLDENGKQNMTNNDLKKSSTVRVDSVC